MKTKEKANDYKTINDDSDNDFDVSTLFSMLLYV